MSYIAIHTTTASLEEAQRIAQHLVEQRLVACAQISTIESWYHWQGALQHEPEWRLVLKTTDAHYAAVESAIRALHSYSLPAIDAVAIRHISAPYADWVSQSTATGSA